MKYESENEMYPHVCHWLDGFLTGHFPNANVDVYDLSKTPISRFLKSYNKGQFAPEQVTWAIRVDIVGFIHRRSQPSSLAFAECKNSRLTLAHLSQLLGYCRVANPHFAFLLSPIGISRTLVDLLETFQRRDVLEYHWEKGKQPRRVIVAAWDKAARNLNRHSIIPSTGI